MKLNKLYLLILLVAVILFAGFFFGMPGKTTFAGNTTEFDIAITHGGYQPNKFTATEGDLIKFLAITTEPTHDHGISIDEFGINTLITSTSPSNPDVIEFVASKVGSFKIYCKTCAEGSQGDHPQLEATLQILPKS